MYSFESELPWTDLHRTHDLSEPYGVLRQVL